MTTVFPTINDDAAMPKFRLAAPASSRTFVRQRTLPLGIERPELAGRSEHEQRSFMERRCRPRTGSSTAVGDEDGLPRVRPQFAAGQDVVRHRDLLAAALLDRERVPIRSDERRMSATDRLPT